MERFAVGEVELTWGDEFSGRASLGAWRHGGSFTRFDGGRERHTTGTYLMLEQELWSAPNDSGGRQSVASFMQLGQADADLTVFETHLGGGVTWSEFVPDHMLGLAVTRVELSDEPGAALSEDHETAIEAFWRWQASPRLVLKPDVQYIVHPGGAGLDDALVVGLRAEWRL